MICRWLVVTIQQVVVVFELVQLELAAALFELVQLELAAVLLEFVQPALELAEFPEQLGLLKGLIAELGRLETEFLVVRQDKLNLTSVRSIL